MPSVAREQRRSAAALPTGLLRLAPETACLGSSAAPIDQAEQFAAASPHSVARLLASIAARSAPMIVLGIGSRPASPIQQAWASLQQEVPLRCSLKSPPMTENLKRSPNSSKGLRAGLPSA